MTEGFHSQEQNPYLQSRWETFTCSNYCCMPYAHAIASRLDSIQGELRQLQQLVGHVQYLYNDNMRLRLDNNAMVQELNEMRSENLPKSIVNPKSTPCLYEY